MTPAHANAFYEASGIHAASLASGLRLFVGGVAHGLQFANHYWISHGNRHLRLTARKNRIYLEPLSIGRGVDVNFYLYRLSNRLTAGAK